MRSIITLIATATIAAAIEKPAFESLEKDGNFELRKYSEIHLVSAPMSGMAQRDDSFRKLFQYISGKNAGEQKIAMTAPVIMEGGPDNIIANQKGRMSFVIPAEVVKAGTPKPTIDGLEIKVIPAATYATLQFKGWTKQESREQAIESLREWIKTKNLKSSGEPTFAVYDPPWKPEFMRTNEVWIRIATK